MSLLARAAAAVITPVLSFRDEVMAEVARARSAGNEHPHRYDPASVTDCITERATAGEPYSAEVAMGDIPSADGHRFGFTNH